MSGRLSGCDRRVRAGVGQAVRLAAASLLFLCCGCSDESDSSAVLAQKVYMHEDRGEYEQAIAAISQLIQREPGNPVLYYDRGVFYEAVNRTDEAFDDYSQALEKSPGHALALNNRAAILARRGDLEAAVRDLDAAIEHNPSHALAYRNRGEAHLDLGRTGQALEDLNQAQQLDATDPLVYFVRGRLHLTEDRPLAALEDLAVALHLGPQHEAARQLRQEVYSRLGVEIAEERSAHEDEAELAPLPQATP